MNGLREYEVWLLPVIAILVLIKTVFFPKKYSCEKECAMELIILALLLPFLLLVASGFFLFFPNLKHAVRGVHEVLFTNLSTAEKSLLIGMGIVLVLKIAS